MNPKRESEIDIDTCDVRVINLEKIAAGKEMLLSDDSYINLAETFRALADSSRLKIVYSLLRQELCVCDLAAVVKLSESAVSQHLRILRNLRLVKNRREGKMVFYSLDDTHINTLLSVCLSHISHGTDQTLDPLEKVSE